MTNAKQLFSLQELDLILDRIQGDTRKAEVELSSSLGLQEVEASLAQEVERLQQLQSQHRLQLLEAEGHRERSTQLDEQLYSGAITNPRDLESLVQESSNARKLLEQHDSELLELSSQAERSQSNRDSMEKELAERSSAWQSRRAELESELKRWDAERSEVAARRDSMAATMDLATVRKYENLRKSKSGLAVAKMERGLCHACRMALPTHAQQKVRGGQEIVLCNSCGRMLLPG